ncbi:MAG: 4'-phosphopantetheinyl transferase superfamily protein [Taibaiella sp.]|nr:4'-phosphopantetheinyl transferase superfamily protein [Taibaiella sp.]
MPLYKEWEYANDTLAAIWHITEPEAFFTEATGIISDIKNEKRRMERLAGRYLLQLLEEEFPLHHIHPDEHDKPRVHNDEFLFSISHSWPYVAVAVSRTEECGIDIQAWHKNIERIQHKFLSVEEQSIFGADTNRITMAWTAKEAAYKWNGRRAVEFIENLPVTFLSKKQDKYNITIYLNLTVPPIMLSIESFIEDDFACSYVVDSVNWAIY